MDENIIKYILLAFFGVFQLVLLILHVLVQYTVYKAGLANSNLYYMLRILSLNDLMLALNGFLVALLKVTESKTKDEVF